MKFLIDNQLPHQLGQLFSDRGHIAVHVSDLNFQRSDDLTIWELSKSSGFVLITKDEDFVFLANRPGDQGQVIWIRLGNCRTRFLLDSITPFLDGILSSLNSCQRIIEVF